MQWWSGTVCRSVFVSPLAGKRWSGFRRSVGRLVFSLFVCSDDSRKRNCGKKRMRMGKEGLGLERKRIASTGGAAGGEREATRIGVELEEQEPTTGNKQQPKRRRQGRDKTGSSKQREREEERRCC